MKKNQRPIRGCFEVVFSKFESGLAASRCSSLERGGQHENFGAFQSIFGRLDVSQLIFKNNFKILMNLDVFSSGYISFGKIGFQLVDKGLRKQEIIEFFTSLFRIINYQPLKFINRLALGPSYYSYHFQVAHGSTLLIRL